MAAATSKKKEPATGSPEPPEHAAPTRDRVGGAAQQEPDALLYRLAHGPHRRRPVPHVRARLRERVGVQSGMVEVALVDGGLPRAAGREARIYRRLERAARRA